MIGDHDTTGKFHAGSEPNTWIGLVTGLQSGNTVLRVRAKSPAGIRDESLQLNNYPITGPIFSGPQLQPYRCMTDIFIMPDGSYLGPSIDVQCSAPPKVA